MRVALFYPAALPPRDYGGTERVVLWLARGLVELGHEVLVGAQKGSQLPAGIRLLEIPSADASAQGFVARLRAEGLLGEKSGGPLGGSTGDSSGGVDILHLHTPPGAQWDDDLPIPSLLTVHGNGKKGEIFPKNSVFLTKNHATRHGATCFVYNGLDPKEYLFSSEKEDWFLFLSKTSWRVKNVCGAIQYCTQARVPLRIAGGRRPLRARLMLEWQKFLGRSLTWEGPVNGHRKAQLLAYARALVFPVLWDEPFGLVVIEALASGTPVIGSMRGSLEELVNERVGVLLPTERAQRWTAVLGGNEFRWSPRECREHVVKYFHYHVMTKNYLNLYEKLRSGQDLNAHFPELQHP